MLKQNLNELFNGRILKLGFREKSGLDVAGIHDIFLSWMCRRSSIYIHIYIIYFCTFYASRIITLLPSRDFRGWEISSKTRTKCWILYTRVVFCCLPRWFRFQRDVAAWGRWSRFYFFNCRFYYTISKIMKNEWILYVEPDVGYFWIKE